MSWKVNDIEFVSVLGLVAQKRYEYLVKKVTDWEELWLIGSAKGIATFVGDNGQILIPVWPHERYAKSCCIDDYSDCSPEAVSIVDWLNLWLPDLEQADQDVAVFPTPQNKAIIVKARLFRQHLEEEMERYL
jgi:hypothetical protein